MSKFLSTAALFVLASTASAQWGYGGYSGYNTGYNGYNTGYTNTGYGNANTNNGYTNRYTNNGYTTNYGYSQPTTSPLSAPVRTHVEIAIKPPAPPEEKLEETEGRDARNRVMHYFNIDTADHPLYASHNNWVDDEDGVVVDNGDKRLVGLHDRLFKIDQLLKDLDKSDKLDKTVVSGTTTNANMDKIDTESTHSDKLQLTMILEEMISEAENYLFDLNDDVERTIDDLGTLDDAIADKLESLDELDAEIDAKEAEWHHASKKVNAIEKRISKLISAIDAHIATLIQLDDEIATDTTHLAELDRNIARGAGKLAQLDEAIADDVDDVVELDTEITTSVAKLIDLEDTIDHNVENLVKLDREIDHAYGLLADLHGDIETVNTVLAELGLDRDIEEESSSDSIDDEDSSSDWSDDDDDEDSSSSDSTTAISIGSENNNAFSTYRYPYPGSVTSYADPNSYLNPLNPDPRTNPYPTYERLIGNNYPIHQNDPRNLHNPPFAIANRYRNYINHRARFETRHDRNDYRFATHDRFF